MSKIITAITEWFRALLWSIAEIFLFLLDCLWQIVLKIGTLNIGNSTVTTKFFAVMSVCMLLFIVFKLVKIYIKFFIDNDYREKINLTKVIISLSLATTLLSGLPLGYRIICNLSSEAIAHVNYWIPSDFLHDYKNVDEINMSDVLIQSGRVNLSDRERDLGEEIKLDENFDINATYDSGDYIEELFRNVSTLDEESMTSENALNIMDSIAGIIGFGSKTYKYFPTWSSIILEIILSIIALYIFALTAIQIAMRSIICSMKYLLAPYMVATIIDPEDNSFGTWLRSIAGDLIANFSQIYFTYFVLILCSNASIQSALGNDWLGIFAKIALFIGGLLAVQEIPNIVSQFFGSSGQSMAETMRGTMMLGSMLAMTGKGAIKGSMSIAKVGAYAVDRAKNIKGIYSQAAGGREAFKVTGNAFAKHFKDKFNRPGFSKNQDDSNNVQDYHNDQNHSGDKTNVENRKKYKQDPGFEGATSAKSKYPSYTNADEPLQKNTSDPSDISNDDYQNWLNAARYYGIENAESLNTDQLRDELSKKGYKFSSMKNYHSSFNKDAYNANLKNIMRKRGKKG